MKLLFENWRKYLLSEKRWKDYGASKQKWFDIPLEDIKQAAIERGGEITLADELYTLIDTAYKKIGGHFKIQNVGDLPGGYNNWMAADLDDDPEPDVLRFGWSGDGGNKLSGVGHDGSRAAIDAYLAKTAQLLKQEGFYGELSKGIAHIMIKYHNVPYVTNKEDIVKILDQQVKWVGPHPEGKYPGYDGWYIRNIAGHSEMKILVGRPKGIKVIQP
tara:strand:- start:16 stop:663 length:648 start_codon:yes stop_codon:yes gene_type:complete